MGSERLVKRVHAAEIKRKRKRAAKKEWNAMTCMLMLQVCIGKNLIS